MQTVEMPDPIPLQEAARLPGDALRKWVAEVDALVVISLEALEAKDKELFQEVAYRLQKAIGKERICP